MVGIFQYFIYVWCVYVCGFVYVQWVYCFDVGQLYCIVVCLFQFGYVGFGCVWVVVEVFVWFELGWVDEDVCYYFVGVLVGQGYQ